MKNIKQCLLFFAAIIFAGFSSANAQEKTAAQIKQMIESQNFIFKAEMVYPLGGSSRSITDYDLTIAPNKVVSYLPYFGKSSAPPVNLSDGGIKFTSTDFEYRKEQGKKSWTITIKPKDVQDVLELTLKVYDDGTGRLDIISTNRQNISYSGYIK